MPFCMVAETEIVRVTVMLRSQKFNL